MVTLQRSKKDGAMVGSCVDTNTRTPKCLCSLTVDKSVFVSTEDSGDPVMYFKVRQYPNSKLGQNEITYLVRFIQSYDSTASHVMLEEQTQANVEQ